MKGIIAQQVRSLREDEFAALAAQNIADAIDLAVILDIYVEAGWTEVKFDAFQGMIRVKAITKWCVDTLEGEFLFAENGTRWVFERADESTLFALKWL